MTDMATQAKPEPVGWQPIETYPRNEDKSVEVFWGPEVLILLPPQKSYFVLNGIKQPEFDVGPTCYVAHLEADMWLIRDEDPIAWSELSTKPTHWMPIPPAPVRIVPEVE